MGLTRYDIYASVENGGEHDELAFAETFEASDGEWIKAEAVLPLLERHQAVSAAARKVIVTWGTEEAIFQLMLELRKLDALENAEVPK